MQKVLIEVPQQLFAQLKQQAEANRRSLNSEIVYCLEQSVFNKRSDLEGLIEQARSLRELTAENPITDDELNAAKNIGRL
ncbi:MAG TPA: Arc family DNA-binding protein [Anaerolineales bacterium]|nr:Arc family DNA-binding protein [Anaerolineales bacterium]